MPETKPPHSSSWISKFIECLFVWLVLMQLVFWIWDVLISRYASNYHQDYWINLFINYCWIFIIISIGCAVWWHIKEKSEKFNSNLIRAWLRGTLRYFLAYAISVYGFAKILGTQFAVTYFQKDELVGKLSGAALTWNYFGYSHTFAVILGLIQIGGSILLLFRRTSLLGVFILLPVMVNVVLINIFYVIATGALVNSLFFTFGLIYLLLLRWKELKILFLTYKSGLPPVRIGILKPVIKVLVIAAAFGTIYQYVVNFKPTIFAGKWKVEIILRNGKVIEDSTWQSNPASWKNIYMEERGMMEISTNLNYFDPKSAKWASYNYDAAKKDLRVVFMGDGSTNVDPINIAVNKNDGKTMLWNTIINKDTLQYKLRKVEEAQ